MARPNGESPFNDQLSLKRLVARYLVTGLVTLTVVAVATSLISRRLGTQEAIEGADRVSSIAASSLAPVVTDELLTLDPAAIQEVDRAVRNQVLKGSLVRVKIWNGDGTILYSDEARLIGRRFEFEEDKQAVLAGGKALADVSDLSEPENEYEKPTVKLLEVYQLITTSNRTPLLFEAYFRYDGVDDAGRRIWLRFAPVSLGALVLLEILQVPLVASVVRRLRRTQNQREALLRSAIEAADTERRRIASDLHDGVVQDLAGVAFSLHAASRGHAPPTPAELHEAADQVRDSVRSLRSLLVEIYPPNLYEEGLEAALTDLSAKLEARGVKTTLRMEAPVTDLATDQVQLVYRAAQEGVRNVAAHAGASRAELRVLGDGHTVRLQVADNGRGIDGPGIEAREGHMGLKALSGLAASMGATVSLESAPGQGTVLTLEVPVR